MAAKPRAECLTPEDRVHHIAQMMADGSYLGGYTIRMELAESWGVSESSIKHYAAEAHRLVSFDPEERQHLQRTLAARLLDIAERAKTTFNVITGMPDFKEERQALIDHARFAGLDLEVKQAPTNAKPVRIEIVYPQDIDEDRSEQVQGSGAGASKDSAG